MPIYTPKPGEIIIDLQDTFFTGGVGLVMANQTDDVMAVLKRELGDRAHIAHIPWALRPSRDYEKIIITPLLDDNASELEKLARSIAQTTLATQGRRSHARTR